MPLIERINMNNKCPKCKAQMKSIRNTLNGYASSQFDLAHSGSGLAMSHWRCPKCEYSMKEYLTLHHK